MKNNRKKFLAVGIVLALIVSAAVSVYAAGIQSPTKITEAMLAGDVCHEHLEQDCSVCDDDRASYRVVCPFCYVDTTLCCSREVAIDDYHEQCFVPQQHSSSCRTVQDLYWNAYICMQCGFYTRGTHSDDMHVEAYWHLEHPEVSDNFCCSLPALDDLRAMINRSVPPEVELQAVGNPIKDPVLAGDYCAYHGIFACDIPHNDVEY